MPYCRNCGQEVSENSNFCPYCGASVTGVAPRQYAPERHTVAIMLFVLGLFLIAMGIGLATVTETVTRYRNVSGFSVPYQVTIHPYEGAGVFFAIIGIVVLVVAFIKTRQRRKKY